MITIDLDDNRLEVARLFGTTQVIPSSDGKAAERGNALTPAAGVDVATTPMLLRMVQSGWPDCGDVRGNVHERGWLRTPEGPCFTAIHG
jgi:hypothetical protein